MARCLGGERRVGERARHGARRRLEAALAIDQAERPVVDVVAAAPPFVGPGERDGAARAFLERGADVHRRDCRLAVFAFADRVGARLGQQQRLVAGDVLQPRQVRAQLGFAMQIDVERADVEERQVEKFGRREVDVGEERVGSGALRVLVAVRAGIARRERGRATARRQAESRCRARTSAPRDDRRARALLRVELSADRALQPAIVEKRDVLRPRQPDHHAQPVPRRLVEQVAPRRACKCGPC